VEAPLRSQVDETRLLTSRATELALFFFFFANVLRRRMILTVFLSFVAIADVQNKILLLHYCT
jgi:hypothetical protein